MFKVTTPKGLGISENVISQVQKEADIRILTSLTLDSSGLWQSGSWWRNRAVRYTIVADLLSRKKREGELYKPEDRTLIKGVLRELRAGHPRKRARGLP